MQTTTPDTSGAPLIEMDAVTIGSLQDPERPVIEQLTWSIGRGDYWLVGGLAESGKTNLLATVAGLLRPLRGRLRLFGREAQDLRGDALLHERLRIGLVFADGGRLFPQMSVFSNVALPLSYHRDCPADAVEPEVGALLESMGLATLAPRPAGRINRMWRQRVALARALILQPEVLLVDNPLAGMEPGQALWWLEFLGQLSSGHACLEGRPLALVIATDDFRPWANQGRQFAIIKDKRWLFIGGPAELAASTEPLLHELMTASIPA